MGDRIVVCDLDGTLSDYGHRIHLLKERDYEAFNAAGINDRPIEISEISCESFMAKIPRL